MLCSQFGVLDELVTLIASPCGRLTLDMMHCPFFLMTYTLPDSIYYLGYDLIYKANWARGYTYNSRGDLGPGFYAGFRSSKLSVVYAGDTDARKSEARDAVLGFSRTREILGGELIFGSSTSPKALSELEHVRCRFRYHTSPHNLGLQQFRLQIFGCQEAGPHSEEQSGTSLRSYRSDSSFTRVPSVYSQGRHFSDNEARKGLTIRAVSEIEEVSSCFIFAFRFAKTDIWHHSLVCIIHRIPD